MRCTELLSACLCKGGKIILWIFQYLLVIFSKEKKKRPRYIFNGDYRLFEKFQTFFKKFGPDWRRTNLFRKFEPKPIWTSLVHSSLPLTYKAKKKIQKYSAPERSFLTQCALSHEVTEFQHFLYRNDLFRFHSGKRWSHSIRTIYTCIVNITNSLISLCFLRFKNWIPLWNHVHVLVTNFWIPHRKFATKFSTVQVKEGFSETPFTPCA